MLVLMNLRNVKISSKKDIQSNNEKFNLCNSLYFYSDHLIDNFKERSMHINLYNSKIENKLEVYSNLNIFTRNTSSIEEALKDFKSDLNDHVKIIENNKSNVLLINSIDEDIYLFILTEDLMSSNILIKYLKENYLNDFNYDIEPINLLEYYHKESYKELLNDFIKNNNITNISEDEIILGSFTITRLLNF